MTVLINFSVFFAELHMPHAIVFSFEARERKDVQKKGSLFSVGKEKFNVGIFLMQ